MQIADFQQILRSPTAAYEEGLNFFEGKGMLNETLRQLAEDLEKNGIVLAGERRSLKIEGFGLGNSPREMTPENVGGKTLFLATTNGTPALLSAQGGDPVMVAAALNFSATWLASMLSSDGATLYLNFNSATGGIPLTATLMKRKDQPQIPASRTRRRTRSLYGWGPGAFTLIGPMSRWLIERRLSDVADRLKLTPEQRQRVQAVLQSERDAFHQMFQSFPPTRNLSPEGKTVSS